MAKTKISKYHNICIYLLSGIVVLTLLSLVGCSKSNTTTVGTTSASNATINTLTASTAGIATTTGITTSVSAIPKIPGHTILLPDAKTAFDSGKGEVFLDVRDQTQYNTDHIPGALFIPFTDLGDNLSEVPHDKQIVVYAECA
jgi:hypothetical protein